MPDVLDPLGTARLTGGGPMAWSFWDRPAQQMDPRLLQALTAGQGNYYDMGNFWPAQAASVMDLLGQHYGRGMEASAGQTPGMTPEEWRQFHARLTENAIQAQESPFVTMLRRTFYPTQF